MYLVCNVESLPWLWMKLGGDPHNLAALSPERAPVPVGWQCGPQTWYEGGKEAKTSTPFRNQTAVIELLATHCTDSATACYLCK